MAFDRELSALTIFCEASGASQAEREAVAHVILNRSRDHRYPHTPAGVCTQRMQFSEWNGDVADNRNLQRGANTPESDAIMQACLAAWDAAFVSNDPTKGATHYHDKSIDPPNWTDGAVMTLETPKFRFYSGVR